MTPVVEGRCWVFPEDNINTDLMMPVTVFRMSRDEQSRHVFGDYRPGWADDVEVGDVIVAGRNFGTGSSRPAPSLMATLGIRAVVAESLNGLFFRNCINSGIAATECRGILEHATEGSRVSFDMQQGVVTAGPAEVTLKADALPRELIEIIEDGGLVPRLKRGGYLKSRIVVS